MRSGGCPFQDTWSDRSERAGEWAPYPTPHVRSRRAGARDRRRCRGFAALQHLDRAAGAGGAGGAGRALAAALAARAAGAEPALAGGDGAGAAGLAAGDRGAAAGAADRGAALPGERADPAALAGGDEAGGGARAGASASRWRRSSPASPASPGRRPSGRTDHAGTAAIALALALVAIPIAAALPAARAGRRRRRRSPSLSAGCGYAWTAIASKLLTDELAAGALLVAVAWLATGVASEGLALLSEMSALQRRPATHVAPVDVRGPGAGAGAARAADLRRVVGRRRRSAAPRWSPSWRWPSPAPSCSPARGRSAP